MLQRLISVNLKNLFNVSFIKWDIFFATSNFRDFKNNREKRENLKKIFKSKIFTRRLGWTLPNLLAIFFSDRRTKKETVYLGMFKAKILVLGPCEVIFFV